MNQDSTKHPRIAVVGLGPIGLILSVFFKEAGCDVNICDNDRVKINLIRNEGVRLENLFQKHSWFNRICTSVKEIQPGEVDAIFLCTKTYQTPSFLQEASFLNDGNLAVVCAQNGLDAEKPIAEVFGEKNTMRMVVNFAGNLNAPNIVKTTFFSAHNCIASMDDSRTELAKGIAEKLSGVGLATDALESFEIIRKIWEKTILNASISAICGIGRLTMAEAMSIPDTAELIEQCIVESVEIAAAEQIHFPDDFVHRALRYLRKGGNHFPSMAVDLINNRPTEIDHFNGKFVEYGRKHYVRTSLHLAFTNMIKAMTYKNQLANMASAPTNGKKWLAQSAITTPEGDCFLGVDLGSSYTKFTIIDSKENIVFRSTLRTMNRDKMSIRQMMGALTAEYPVKNSCATGYGKNNFSEAETLKPESECAAAGVHAVFPHVRSIIDIGGDNLRIIYCDEHGNVLKAVNNDKCAAGTGDFLLEVADRTGFDIREMSNLAKQSNSRDELNCVCTVFANSDIMKWLQDGVPLANLAKGVYLSIVRRIANMGFKSEFPTCIIGGVITHHPHLKQLLEQEFGGEFYSMSNPQHMLALGAALLARSEYMEKLAQKVQVI